ncbi:MAG: hypothetical protein AAB336_09630 [Acidobacteriota bacterium]
MKSLEQGDLLPNCPVIYLPNNLKPILEAKESDEIEITPEIKTVDLIIMTQSCDLENNKVEEVLLCGYFPFSEDEYKRNKDNIKKERMPALHLIEKCDGKRINFEKQVIDFRAIYTLPKNFVIAYAKTLGFRARLLSPYKEHLSQAFARYFMRVGLPRPLIEE